METFFRRLQDQPISSDVEDKLLWLVLECDNLLVKFLYFMSNRRMEDSFSSMVWNPWIC